MKGDFKLQAECPSCKKRISVYASETDGRCPECREFVPQLQFFMSNETASKAGSTAAMVFEKPNVQKIVPKLTRKDIEIGSFITSKFTKDKIFIVIKIGSNSGNKVFTCLRVVNKDERKSTDRYVFAITATKFVVFDSDELIYFYNVTSVKPRVSNQIITKMLEAYDKYNKGSNAGQKEKHNVAPYDGFRNGNAWEGIITVPGHIKVYRG